MKSILARVDEWTHPTADFYRDTVQHLIKRGDLRPDMRVLVVCGGERDRDVLLQCGLRNVTISNLDTRMRGDEFDPFCWSFQDAENLTFQDGEFDFSIAHSGLHHCFSPHRALLEMYRVSRVGVLVFEPRDGLFVRLGVLLNLGQEYEVAAVFGNDMAFGGVRNTEIPNYVYRWTESEVRKTINSYAPFGQHRFSFFYATRVPWSRLRMLRNKLYLAAVIASLPFLKALSFIFPKVCNNFAFMVLKPRIPNDLFPWLTVSDGKLVPNREWLTAHYRRGRAALFSVDS
jgi:ubiquinone/menaquinone biosynthesis C-methylase UbiE